MKRIIAGMMVLCLLCGLFVGCEKEPSATQTEATTAQTETTTMQTEAATVATEPITVTEAVSVPEIVYHYSPQYTRLSDEPIYELKPADDYGCILPFAGEASPDVYCGNCYTKSGFIDANGRIIVDPVFHVAGPLMVDYGYAFEPCVWLLGMGDEVVVDYTGYHSELVNARYGLSKWDGSVVIDLKYDEIDVLGNHIFAMTYLDGDSFEYDADIYNFDCELVGSISGLTCCPEGFAEGILRGSVGSEYYYIDLSGNVIAGPFLDAEDFSCGYGLVQVETEFGDRYTYVGKDGKFLSEDGWLFTPEGEEPYQIMGFSHAESFVNGVASVEATHMWEHYNVLTTENEFLFEFRIFDKYQCTEEYILNSALNSTEVYNHKGELLWSLPDWELERMTSSRAPLLYDSYNNKIYNWKTGEVRDGFDGMISDWDLYDADYPYYVFVDDEMEKYIVADENLDILCSFDQYVSKSRDACNGTPYFEEYGENGCLLTLPHLGITTEGISAMEMWVFNDMIMCLDGGACRYYNKDLELVFCYPFATEAE